MSTEIDEVTYITVLAEPDIKAWIKKAKNKALVEADARPKGYKYSHFLIKGLGSTKTFLCFRFVDDDGDFYTEYTVQLTR